LKELKEGLNVEFDLATDKISFERAIDVLQEKLNNKISFVTLSEHGVFVQSSSNKSYIPAHIRTISDVSGAGDTVISVATLCLAVGLAPQLIAEIANLSGGLVCEVSGVVPINKAQLMEEMVKIIDA
jgi:bifunctional ADP-heptose synthase (sugar kinase/adenylyltransferase)